MDLISVFQILIENFQKHNIRFALMGGFAMHAAGYSRTTQDIDMLVLKEDMPKVKEIMSSLGYELIFESEDVSNFRSRLKELGRVDFLHAHREYAKNMLKRAKKCGILNDKFSVSVLAPEDLIGLKVQSSSNDPERYHRDMADIEFLIRHNPKTLNLELIREYFSLFSRGKELDDILARIPNA